MKTYGFYDLTTGLLAPHTCTVSDDQIGVNTPAGMAPVLGLTDPLSQRVDIATGDIVDYQPPKPDDTVHTTYAWDASTKRWVGTATDARIALTVRQDRDARMKMCDWVVARETETGIAMGAAWKTYRQALRDITLQPGFPSTVVWPLPPS